MKHNIKLASSEIGSLWSSYMMESASLPVLQYFSEKVEDKEVKSVVQKALKMSEHHIKTLTDIFNDEKFPVPIGFSSEDVNVTAPRLFSDTYMLYFLRNLGEAGIVANGAAFSMAAREDIRKLYRNYLNESADLEDETKAIMLSKGIFVRAPYMDFPDRANFVEKQSFLRGWFGEKRTITADEAAHIFMNYTNNTYGKALMIGFSQVANSEELRNYFIRGQELARKILRKYRLIFEESTLPAPMTWDSEVSNSTISPFSDKLMLFQTTTLNALSIGNSGGSLALSFRRDIAAMYAKDIKDIGLFAEDGANLMIKNGWFERPPQASDREYLSKEKDKK
ncbi:DUF3231 family protein [Radiobacillus sp. PE A8.2]|uniref:DUF3231 family protein n=1 Tax=Radiobacillus sp. PE A8.2 TaxID=3380349 RepID=UPI003890CFA5